MLNLKISKRQASPADLRLSRQSARFEDLLRRTDKDALMRRHRNHHKSSVCGTYVSVRKVYHNVGYCVRLSRQTVRLKNAIQRPH